MIHMKCQALFSLKSKKNSKCRPSVAVVISLERLICCQKHKAWSFLMHILIFVCIFHTYRVKYVLYQDNRDKKLLEKSFQTTFNQVNI